MCGVPTQFWTSEYIFLVRCPHLSMNIRAHFYVRCPHPILNILTHFHPQCPHSTMYIWKQIHVQCPHLIMNIWTHFHLCCPQPSTNIRTRFHVWRSYPIGPNFICSFPPSFVSVFLCSVPPFSVRRTYQHWHSAQVVLSVLAQLVSSSVALPAELVFWYFRGGWSKQLIQSKVWSRRHRQKSTLKIAKSKPKFIIFRGG